MSDKKLYRAMTLSVSCLLLMNIFIDKSDGKEIELALTRDGRPNAVIVIGKEASQPVRFAAKEIQYHIQKISGALLPITNDEQEVTGNRILVGESAATRALGLKNDDFKSQEYLVRFLPDTLVLMGRDQSPFVAPSPVKVFGEIDHKEGKFGNAFGISSDALILADSGFCDKEGSLEAWVKMSSATGTQGGTILRIDGANPWTYHIISQFNGIISYATYSHAGKRKYNVNSGSLQDGWHHILATHSAADNKMELFVDGVTQGNAKYVETTCGGRLLYAGGLVTGKAGKQIVGNAFDGLIDEIRVSRVVRKASELDLNKAPEIDNQTTLLLHCDEKEGLPANEIKQVYISRPLSQPGRFDEQGSCYAVYDFLERFCGVRWYAPTELGMVYPTLPTLTVKGNEVRRKPVMEYRDPNNCPVKRMGEWLWNHPDVNDVALFYCRLKVGGLKYQCNHSFGGYYNRFWKKHPKAPEVFEGEHPEYFAQNWPDAYPEPARRGGRPPQLCYTNPELLKQVVQDARDYFDGKGLKTGAKACGDYFGLEPMDNAYYCVCSNCRPLWKMPEKKDPPPGASSWHHFSQGYSSDYWFAFVNKVAKEIKKSHPDKYIATLAYGAKAVHPSFPLESNVAVQMCFATRLWECIVHEGNHEKKLYQTWLADSKDNGRPLFLWLYYNFPEFWEYRGPAHKRFYCFPGFFAHTAARQIKMFARDGIRGIFIEVDGYCDPIDLYLTCKLMDDPSLDTDTVLDEFFTRYYGSAAKPMRELYLAIEETYSNPEYYPEMVRTQTEWQFHQTEEMAWGYLGTEERMKRFGKLMEQAKAAAKTDIDKKRVELFEKGIWDHMVKGREHYLDNYLDPEARKQREVYRDKLESEPPPSVTVPAVTDGANGDPVKVDWSKALTLGKWSTVMGYPTNRKISALLAHDQHYFYVHLEEIIDTSKLVNDQQIWQGDDWELFFSIQRGKRPYTQLGVNPAGIFKKLARDEKGTKEWKSEIKIVSIFSGKDKWIVSIALPLETLLPGGVKTGQKFYANFYRAVAVAKLQENLAWSPNFSYSFHKLGRFGELVLE